MAIMSHTYGTICPIDCYTRGYLPCYSKYHIKVLVKCSKMLDLYYGPIVSNLRQSCKISSIDPLVNRIATFLYSWHPQLNGLARADLIKLKIALLSINIFITYSLTLAKINNRYNDTTKNIVNCSEILLISLHNSVNSSTSLGPSLLGHPLYEQ